MALVTIELPDDLVLASGRSPEDFFSEIRVAAAIRWYIEERISQEMGASIAGLDRLEFLDRVDRAKADTFQFIPAEPRAEVESDRVAHSERFVARPAEAREAP